MAEVEKKWGNMADQLKVAKKRLENAEAEVAAVKTDLVKLNWKIPVALQSLKVLRILRSCKFWKLLMPI